MTGALASVLAVLTACGTAPGTGAHAGPVTGAEAGTGPGPTPYEDTASASALPRPAPPTKVPGAPEPERPSPRRPGPTDLPDPTEPAASPGRPGPGRPTEQTAGQEPSMKPAGPAPGDAARTAPGPDLSRTTGPSAARKPPATGVRPGPGKGPGKGSGKGSGKGPGKGSVPTIRIGSWSAPIARGGQEEVDACRNAVQWAGPDFGAENGYQMRTIVLVGHDFCGFDRFATLPVGSEVTIETPRGTRTYQVYATYISPGRGTPAAGLYWGDLTLQSCVGPDTGFSYLTRV
ncbi:hypothetical protein ACFXKG_40080 [Streptomyces sp. NPDC059255]|uniref:hypothetical protein n=1 Tax=Streptomyces sp. NPDC059255 TaxID=3346793 RepID=UPI0036B71425